MKLGRVIDLVIGFSVGVMIMVIAGEVRAQTPTPRPDIPLLLVDGKGPMRCHTASDADMAQVCFVRTDQSEPVELGCITAGPDEDIIFDLEVPVTLGDDGLVRCYAVDTSGLGSDYSENAGLADFSQPGAPYVY